MDLRESWDEQQEAYLPYREEAFGALIDVVATIPGRACRVLDLAGGLGSLSARVLRRLPGAEVTLVDVDPVLLEIARRTLPHVRVLAADLAEPAWTDALPPKGFQAVVVTTALHCFDGERIRALYAELRGLLAPGGVLLNADLMPDPGLPTLNARLRAPGGDGWSRWWAAVSDDPTLSPLLAARPELTSADFYPPADWHLDALREAGFDECGVIWRRYGQAAVAGLRA